MKDVKTLAAIAAEVESGKIYYRETTIKVGNFESFADFLSYYDRHYKPLLEAIRDGEAITADRRHLLNFLADDLIKMFHHEDGE